MAQGAVALVAAVAVLVVATVGYGWYRYQQIDRKDLALASPADGPQNFLVVGSDSRDSVSADDADADAFLNEKGADQLGRRADTIMIARVDPQAKTVDLLSFPRDLWIPIMPSGEPQRINTAYASGTDGTDGAQRLIDTIKADFDIDINHYVEINFSSFKGIVEAVGGVPLYFEHGVRDENSGFFMYDPGCQVLNGEQGLAYARARHLEYWNPTTRRWISDPTADLGRISRQTIFMRTIVDRAQSQFGELDVKAINDLVASTASNLSLDSNLDFGEVVSLARSFRGFSGDQIRSHALPVYPTTTSGGASVLKLDTALAQPILNIFRGLPPDHVSPSSVTMAVSNGSGVEMQATSVARQFSSLGFSASPVADATRTVTTTTVRYAPGYERQADLVSRHLGAGVRMESDPTLTGSPTPVILVTGTDFAGVANEPRPATTTTTVTDPSVSTSSTTSTPPVTIASGEVTTFIGVDAGEAPEGIVCN